MALSIANGIASTTRKTFSRETSVSLLVKASPEVLWSFITHASAFPQWNSTVISIKGEIAFGQTIQLVSTLDPSRTFKLKVSEFEVNKRLTWGDPMGKRVFSLAAQPDGSTMFSMSEKIGGPLFPLFARMIPSFDQSFTQFGADLKKAAESANK